jgi:hypothetical protein
MDPSLIQSKNLMAAIQNRCLAIATIEEYACNCA